MNIAVILESNLQQNSQNVDIYYARYVSLRLWNQLPTSLRQLLPSLSISDLPVHVPTTSPHSIEYRLTTLTIHNSISLSLPAQNLPLSQIFPTIDSLLYSLMIDSTNFMTGPLFLRTSIFVFF